MIMQLTIGLTALANISGIEAPKNYSFSEQDIKNVYQMCGESYENDFIYYDIYSIFGENRYLELKVNDFYILYDKKTDTIIEMKTWTENPYINYKDEFKIYIPNSKEYEYGVFVDDSFVDIENKNVINFNGLFYESKYQQQEFMPSENAKLIDNSFYFLNLKDYHSLNNDGTCTLISTQILLGYYDTFFNDNLVAEEFEFNVQGDFISCSDFKQSPGLGKKYDTENGQKFHDYLVDMCIELGFDPIEGSDSGSEHNKLLTKYLDDSGIEYEKNCTYNVVGGFQDKAKSIIKNGIDNNRPVIANGSGHSTVVYGYDDDYVYMHSGWGYVSRVSWDAYELKIGNVGKAFDIIIKDKHVHSNNYYSTKINKFLCPCSEKSIEDSGTYDLLFDSVVNTYKIKFIAQSKLYVSFNTIGDYDTSFYNIKCDSSYDYYDDQEGISDSEYNYNASLSVWEIEAGSSVEFYIDGVNGMQIILSVYTYDKG